MAAVSPIPVPPAKREGDGLDIKILRAAFLLVLVGGSAYALWTHAEWFENPRLIKAELLSLGAWGPIAYILLYAIGPSFLVPGAVMTIAGGLAFGVFWGAIWSLVGANLGALIAFAAGRFLGKSFVEGIIGKRFQHLMQSLVRNGFYVILYLRLVPVIPYNALNLLAGASPITFRDYLWATLLGMIPGTVLFAFLGDALWHPTSPRFFVAIGLIVCCFAGGEAYRRWKRVPVTAET
jgi:uncharacterized membrane protein YdjX (TVP38/TMEM64 family)